MKSRLILMLGALCGLWLSDVSLVAGQQQQSQKTVQQDQQSSPATNADIETLKRQIQELLAGQIAVQKQLDEIKAMLRPAPPASPVAIIDTLIDVAGAA